MRLYGAMKTVIRRFFLAAGVFFVLLFALCWTSYPWRVYHWLSMPDARLDGAPEWIVVLGGGGVPSESGLMRTYYGARIAEQFPDARILIALPADPDSKDSALRRMQDELVMRGVDRARIDLLPHGANTRAQAVAMRERLTLDDGILVVTSPEHVRRAVRTFGRAGFERVGAHAAADTHAEGSMMVTEEGVGDTLRAPTVEGSLTLRYRFWNHLTYLTRSAREFVALGYYKMKGWI